ncbi:hypothetical protein ACP70R_004598 [Stipagrostis hirtigluma subsp. patula]
MAPSDPTVHRRVFYVWIQLLTALQICINVCDRSECRQSATSGSCISSLKVSQLKPLLRLPDRLLAFAVSMASLVHQASLPASAMACDDEFATQGFTCFGRSLSRSSSSSRLEYRALREQGEEKRAVAQEARSARAKLRWKAVAQEIMARRGGGGARRRRQQLAAFSYDSRSYALNFDQGADE